jgi:hypothetical protein
MSKRNKEKELNDKLFNIQGINIQDIPDDFSDVIWDNLPINGGNVVSVDKDEAFGKFLISIGFKFPENRDWEWVVVFR